MGRNLIWSRRTFSNIILDVVGLFNKITGRGQTKIQILRDFEGLVKSGELLVVLGKPGSGCSTLLKTITGETHGFFIDSGSTINYQGVLILIIVFLQRTQLPLILCRYSVSKSPKNYHCSLETLLINVEWRKCIRISEAR